MNNDLISRSALLKEISTKTMMYDGSCIKKGIGVLLNKWEVLDHIQVAPAIDAELIKRGRWVEASGGRIICNRCGNYPLYDYHGRQKFSPVCWNCGARMGGEEDGKGD